ncbi:hypothetical protein LTR17_005730 [Elasticomyces elasticus]|nr:hypothetical protein LTR17_005730 [Elasticomyces elasticus]
MSGDPWGVNRCECDGCEALRVAHQEAKWICGHRREPAHVREAAEGTLAGMQKLIEALHREHMPQYYETDEANDSGWSEQLDDNVRTEDDHDDLLREASAGRPSNGEEFRDEAQVRSIMFSHEARLTVLAREQHIAYKFGTAVQGQVYVPDFCTIEEYIILPGLLRDYMIDGAVRRHDWSDYEMNALDWARLEAQMKQRQQRTRDEAERFVEDGRGTLKSFFGGCGAMCGSSPEMEVDRENDMFDKEARKEARANLRMMVREETDAMVEAAHENGWASVPGCECMDCEWWDSMPRGSDAQLYGNEGEPARVRSHARWVRQNGQLDV